MEKTIHEDDLKSDQELYLYLKIMLQQEKYEEAFNYFEGPTAKLLAVDRISNKISLLKSLKRWPQLNIFLKDLLQKE